MADGNDSQLRSGRPKIAIDGRENPDLAAGLLALLTVETSQGLSRCEATFGNWGAVGQRTDFLYFDRKLLDFGARLTVTIGRDTVFEGRITALEGRFPDRSPPEFTALAEDRLQDLRMTRRTRTFSDVSDADLVRHVAQGHGLGADVDLPGPTHRSLAQVNQSDLAFLRDRARAVEAELWVEEKTLHAKPRAGRGGGSLRLGYRRELRDCTVTADLSHQRTAVIASGWDVAGKATLQHEADDAVVHGELGRGSSGAKELRAAFGERKESIAHAVPLVAPEAKVRAEAHFKQSARRFVVVQGVAQADGRLRVGAFVELDGLGDLFSGKYYLAEVQHVFDGVEGLRTEFVGERPGIGGASGGGSR
jgi:phage protein D